MSTYFSLFRRTGTAALFIFLLAPLVAVIIVSVNAGATPKFPPEGFSLRWYGAALANPAFTGSALTSLVLAAVATALGTPLGVAAAFGIARGKLPSSLRGLLEAIFLSPLIVPGIVIGVALLVTLSTAGLRDAWLRLTLGHVLLVMPYVIRTSLAALQSFDPSLEEAAHTLGASRRQILTRVTLPVLRPAIFAGAAFGFIISFDDAAVSIFLIDSSTSTLPLAIMSYMQYNFDPSIAAVSSMLIAITLAGALVIERVFGLKKFLGN
ncbi:MAG: ABC transporter permease [Rhodobacteraceae bacterium]|uniref:ABC transporter permease n=1 Tax=Salipiger sp. HF18 TaxID=2721557 RepID=UPI00142DAD79|nr:ABC transporter permease [Salipiger sp. HF18]NVK61343.1 ABC transporter permease [Paracoccaceae bacterium]